MQFLTDEDSQSLIEDRLDLGMFGQRLRHVRRARGMTLADLGQRVGRAPSVLSLIENGRREPKLSLISSLASVLSVTTEELMRRQPPSRRAELEIALEEAQRDPVFAELGLPYVRAGARVPSDIIEHVVALHAELRKQRAKPTATPEEARAANADLRAMMRGFSVRYVQDLPRSARSVTDLRNRRIYLKQESQGMHTPRAVLLQTLGHFVLGHAAPLDFAEFLSQRVEANYFAAAVLVPEAAAASFLSQAKEARNLSVEDLRDVFSVSYEMAAHRFTNLATHHLDLPCHFVKNDASGVIYKAYENDRVVFPADPSGAIEGQRLCRQWSGRQVFGAADRFSPYCQYSDTPSGTYFCVAQVDPRADRGFAITLGVPFEHSRWFRGREATTRTRSACPDGECCSRPPAALAERWEGQAWPSARAHSHILSALPAGSFPGVDDADIYEFLDQHARE